MKVSSQNRRYERVLHADRWLALCFLFAVWAPNAQGQTMGGSPQGPPSACPNNNCPGIGNAFYLPDFNSLDEFTGGKTIFQNRTLGNCVTFNTATGVGRDFNFTDNSFQFFTMASGEADLKGSYDTLEFTLDQTFKLITNQDAANQSNVQSLVLDITYLTGVLDFQMNNTCWAQSNVDPDLLAAFTQLPVPIADPTGPASWTPYITFLQSWGSHIMVQQSLGSRFQQWESVMRSQNISENDLQMKACADVEGLSEGGGWSVSACGAYSSAQKTAVDSLAIHQKLNVLGGTDSTRQGLLVNGQVTEESLNAFIQASGKADEAIKHGWVPIWQLLSLLYSPNCTKQAGSCDNYQRALNLEAAYEGWLALGCPLIPTDNPQLPVQRMQVASTDPATGIQTYGCWVTKEGCVDGGSCHGGGFAGGVCYCYGNGCIVVDTTHPVGDPNDPTDYRETLQFVQTGSYNVGVNNSCYHYGFTCNCDSNAVVGAVGRYLWEQSGSE